MDRIKVERTYLVVVEGWVCLTQLDPYTTAMENLPNNAVATVTVIEVDHNLDEFPFVVSSDLAWLS